MIIVLCEGQTEERFIKEIVIPAFSHLYIVPKIIMTKGGKKGGSVHYEDFLKQVKQILHNTQVTLLLTMFDLAGIPSSWWDESNCPKYLNDRLKKDIDDSRFYPLWMVYEFEIVAFIAPEKSGEVVGSQYISALEKVLKNNQHNPSVFWQLKHHPSLFDIHVFHKFV